MQGHLTPPVRRARLEQLLAVGRESALAFRRRFLGRTMGVLWEEEVGGLWQGLTGNYIRVYASSELDLSNRITSTRLTALAGADVSGSVVELLWPGSS